jgi:hypothetical protein
MSNIGKTLKDYNPTPSTLQGGQTFQLDKAPLPNNYESGPFDASRSSNSESSSPESEESGTSGPFCKVYKDSETNKWKLLGGTVTGGDKTETIADITIGNVDSEPEDGTFYWVAIAFKANVEDDVLLSGGDIQGVLIEDGPTIRDNRTPTVAQPSGRLYISIGEWMEKVFVPAGCGNIQISHCPGTLSYSRG